ncbi:MULTISPECIES: hypothetical protein [unclassified Microcoleus]|uniref:hypothetical protein n=1 Tax=unclassified Microcoleus TaxID=2642155 RepID=UPI002FD14B5E
MSAIRSGITQATASAEGTISAEGNIGKNKAQWSIDSEGIWDLGIDFKVGGLGITNDYGGAITVSIAGQSITWGREGGKIHYDLGGFELIVEARDCVVTETKIIMGIVVASHTYPDPGCELPDPPEPLTPTPTPTPTPGGNNEIPDTQEIMWVVCDLREEYWRAISYSQVRLEFTNLYTRTITEQEKPISSTVMPFTLTETQTQYPNTIHKILKSNSTSPQRTTFVYLNSGASANVQNVTSKIMSSNGGANYFSTTQSGGNYARSLCFYGTGAIIKKYIEYSKTRKEEILVGIMSTGYYTATTHTFENARIIPLIPKEEPKPQPFLQPGVPPHMNDCCEEIIDSLEDLKEVLHVDFFKKSKFPVPSYLLAPGCTPDKKVEAKNYYNLFQMLFQAIAHGTIISPKIDIQDADAVKEGDQTINSEYLSATGWAEAVTKMLYEIVDDGNISTNMDIRTGVTVTQLMVAVADLSYKLDCVIDMIGIPTKRTKGEIETSYNLMVEGESTKGFDPKKSNQQLDLNQDISTEKLLSSLLRTRKNPIVKEEIHPKAPTLFEMIKGLINGN